MFKRNRIANSETHRVWETETIDESRLLTQFLNICNSKMTVSEAQSIKESDIRSFFEYIKNGTISIEKIQSLSSDELYDLIIGQLRLF